MKFKKKSCYNFTDYIFICKHTHFLKNSESCIEYKIKNLHLFKIN